MNDDVIVFAIAVSGVVVLSISYWLIFRSDLYVLGVASSVIGGLIGYIFGRRGERNAKG